MVRLKHYDEFTSIHSKNFIETLLANNHELDINSDEK